MDRADLLDGFPVPPPDRRLPDHAQRRADLLTAVRVTGRADRRPARHRRLVPLAAAAAVLAILVPLSLAGSHLLRSSPVPVRPAGSGPANGTHPGGSGFLTSGHGPASFSRGEWHRTDTLTAGGPLRSLTVSAGTGDITISGTSGSTVSVTEQVSYRGTPPQLANGRTGSRLVLGYTCGPGDCGVSYTIKVPRGMTVTARTNVGAIHLSALAGQIVARTGTGSVNGTDLSARSTDLNAQVGDVRASFAAVPRTVRVSTDTGSITIRVPSSQAYAVTATADVGMIQVTVPRAQSSAHAISAHSDVGSVSITGGLMTGLPPR
jgi:hypothetical protein